MLLIAFAPEAVRIFAPKSYYEAIYCIPPVAMGVLFLYSYDLFAKFVFYYERTIMIMLASIWGAILNIAYKISKRCSLRNNDYEQKENEEIVFLKYDNEKKNGQDNRNLWWIEKNWL